MREDCYSTTDQKLKTVGKKHRGETLAILDLTTVSWKPKVQARIKIAKFGILNLYASQNIDSTVKKESVEWEEIHCAERSLIRK